MIELSMSDQKQIDQCADIGAGKTFYKIILSYHIRSKISNLFRHLVKENAQR